MDLAVRHSPTPTVRMTCDTFPYETFYRHVRNVSKEAKLAKPICPHRLRHTRATLDSKYFTDREMMMRHGWKSPQTVGVYSHLSRRDVDNKDFALHGLKKKEEILRPIMQIQVCPDYKQQNAPIALFCNKCGRPLGGVGQAEEIQKLRAELAKARGEIYKTHQDELLDLFDDLRGGDDEEEARPADNRAISRGTMKGPPRITLREEVKRELSAYDPDDWHGYVWGIAERMDSERFPGSIEPRPLLKPKK
jgi:hypothetical protein